MLFFYYTSEGDIFFSVSTLITNHSWQEILNTSWSTFSVSAQSLLEKLETLLTSALSQ